MLLHGSTSSLPIASDLALDMIVLKRTRKQTGSRGVGPPVRYRQAADEAQHLGQVLALRPVVGDLVFEVVEADLGVVPVRGRASWSVSNRTITRAFPGGRRCGSLMWISPFSSIWASISMACVDFRLFGRYSLSAQPAFDRNLSQLPLARRVVAESPGLFWMSPGWTRTRRNYSAIQTQAAARGGNRIPDFP